VLPNKIQQANNIQQCMTYAKLLAWRLAASLSSAAKVQDPLQLLRQLGPD